MSTGTMIREIRREQKDADRAARRAVRPAPQHRLSCRDGREGISLENFEKLLAALGHEMEIMKCE